MIDLNSLDAYDFQLPESLIAQNPVEPRDSSRLLVIDRAQGKWFHKTFLDLPSYIDANDVLVANNSRVIRARLLGKRINLDGKGQEIEGGKVEFLMLEEKKPRVWEGMFHAAAKHKPGVKFLIPTPDGKGLRGVLTRGASDSPQGTVEAEFDRDPIESGAGVLPLPPYIERGTNAEDDERYQTVYSKQLGSAAAPTAGLHFTPRIMQALQAKGASWEEVTLHVGLGTFRPVKAQDVREHSMHDERFEIDSATAERLTRAKQQGKRILAVGTTSVRTLESAWEPKTQSIQSGIKRTSIFIRPGAYQFQVVDRMLTNFHLPKSTLLMLVSAFAGRDLVLAAYQDAVREKYRFFSYGDAMLIL